MIQLPQDLLLDIENSITNLLNDMDSSQPPEATAYLTLLGREMGYVKTSEMKQMADTLYTYYQTFFKELPAKVKAFQKLQNINSKYIFIDLQRRNVSVLVHPGGQSPSRGIQIKKLQSVTAVA